VTTFFPRFFFSFLLLGFWLFFMFFGERFELFLEYWPVSLTMAFGSFVAGATAEGGGAVAFPVFTKALQIPPVTARDFALAIQSVGMTCGALLIARSGYPFLKDVFFWSFLGGALSLVFGLELASLCTVPHYPKIFFSLFTLTFGGFLVWMNISPRNIRENLVCRTRAQKLEFFLCGVVGGLVAGFLGSGADVVLFILLCLRYDVDEKIGTRTTVFLMASLSMVGFLYLMLSGKLATKVIPMWLCALPIVAFGAPFGAIFCSWQKRKHVVAFLIFLIILEFFTTVWLVPFDFKAKIFSVVFLVFASILMFLLRLSSVRSRI